MSLSSIEINFLPFCSLVAPTITDLSPPERIVTSPSAARFTCNATGRPRPSISWYRVELDDSRTLLPDDQSIEMESGEREISSTLTVSPTSAADAADYVCVASNIVDNDEMITNLTVYGNLQFSHVFRYTCRYVHSSLKPGFCIILFVIFPIIK